MYIHLKIFYYMGYLSSQWPTPKVYLSLGILWDFCGNSKSEVLTLEILLISHLIIFERRGIHLFGERGFSEISRSWHLWESDMSWRLGAGRRKCFIRSWLWIEEMAFARAAASPRSQDRELAPSPAAFPDWSRSEHDLS
jgi:hypothetical protein